MKISVFYDHILQAMEQTGRTRLDLFKEVKTEGIDALEISATHLKKDYRQLMADLRESRLTISCIYETYDLGKRSLWLAAKKQVDLAKKVGASSILIIPGFLSDEEAAVLNSKSSSYEETTICMNASDKVQNMKVALIKLVSYASSKGVSVTLEDYDGKTAPFSRTYQLKWFVQNVPGLKITLDLGNFAFCDEDVKQAYIHLSKYIVHVHCKDRAEESETNGKSYNRGLKPAPCGQGYIPIRDLLSRLLADGYNGYLAIEHFDAPDQMAFMRASAAYLKDILQIEW